MKSCFFALRSFTFFFVPTFFAAVLPLCAQDFAGRIVTSVAYVPVKQPIDPRDLKNMQLIEAGRPLDPRQVAATIDRLFASGLYDNIEVDAEPSGDGVALRFITHARLFVGHVGARGKISDPPSRGVILSHTQLQLGSAFDPGDLQIATKNIQQLLRENGLYQGQAGVETLTDPDIHNVTIRFDVEAGKRARYERPIIKGDTKLSDGAIIHATGWRIPLIHWWRQVTQALTDKGVSGIQKKYQKQDRLAASVNITSFDYNPDTVRLKPTLDINAGPKIEIRAVEAKVKKSKLHQLVPVYALGSVNNDLLTQGARNLHDYFQSRGYPDVDVTFKAEPPVDDEQIINYYIATGPRRRLVHIAIEGSEYFTLETVRERMFLHTSTFAMRYGRYSEAFRRADEKAIADLYKANGFRDARVTSDVVMNYKGKPEDIAVVFHIDQGKQWLVHSLTIGGAARLDVSRIRNQLMSMKGQPYADVNIASDRNRILDFYYNNGFSKAGFSYTTTPGPEPATVNVSYHITEGPQEFVRQVIITGLYRTHPSLVEKKIHVAPGEPVSMQRINDAAQRLTDLGIFSNVNTALQNPDGTTAYKYVLYDFDEASAYSLQFGFGLEVGQFGSTTNNLAEAGGAKGVSPIVSAAMNRINFLGTGQTLAVLARYSTLEQRESINYILPQFLGSTRRSVTFSLLYDTTQNVQTFSSRREEASVQESTKFNRASTLILRFAYRRVSTANVVIPALLIPQFLQPVRIGILSASYAQDHRDDPIDAHHGFWNTVDAGIAGNFFGSQRNFTRVLARNATYTPIGRNLVFARQTQIGVIVPFNIAPGSNSFNDIPLPERFFGGGSVSMRGFGDNQAGPRDIGTPDELPSATIPPINCGNNTHLPKYCPTGFPIGGNGLFFNTFELRFPLLFPNLSGVVFHDMGNIYTTFSDISFRYHQPSIQDFNYAVQAVGFGVRYKTPVGPVRLDLAYALNPTSFLGFNINETIQDLIKCGNSCVATPQHLSHFQFFFSIGQAF